MKCFEDFWCWKDFKSFYWLYSNFHQLAFFFFYSFLTIKNYFDDYWPYLKRFLLPLKSFSFFIELLIIKIFFYFFTFRTERKDSNSNFKLYLGASIVLWGSIMFRYFGDYSEGVWTGAGWVLIFIKLIFNLVLNWI